MAKINEFFDTPNIEEPPLEVSMDAVARELTGGRMTQWASKFPAKHLTAMMAVLFRLCIHNWIPTKNNNLVTATVGVLLYKLKMGIPINFGQYVFNRIGEFTDKGDVGVCMYPYMIHGFLKDEGFAPTATDRMQTKFESIKVTHQTLTTNRVQDLPWSEDQPVPIPAPPVDVAPIVVGIVLFPHLPRPLNQFEQGIIDQIAALDVQIRGCLSSAGIWQRSFLHNKGEKKMKI